MARIAIDAGHGGMDSGAVYNGREEKNDVLKLALAVGDLLEKKGIDVAYIRTEDVYDTPFKKAQTANMSEADLFVSIHRNSGTVDNTAAGVQSLVYKDSGIRKELGENIKKNLVNLGFKDLGTEERPNLVVLKRTSMPAVLMEVGFINNEEDNKLFDEKFNEIARAIADGIYTTLKENNMLNMTAVKQSSNMAEVNTQSEYYKDEKVTYDEEGRKMHCICNSRLYRVQVGAFKNRDNAENLLNSLLQEDFPAYIIYEDDMYKVQVGAFEMLANAVSMENRLRKKRYSTYIVS